MRPATRKTVVRTSIAALLAVPFILPFLFLVGTALRTREDYVQAPGGLPSSLTFEHLVEAWQQADLGRAMLNTLLMCAVACVVCGTSAVAAAYWFRLQRARWAGPLRLVLAAGYAIPMVAWLIPVFAIAAQGRLVGSVVVAGIVSGVSSLPFAFFFVHTFLRQALSDELIEAAALDGAGPLRSFAWIGLPMAMPALAAALALTFVWTFGDLLVAATLLQADPSSYTITLAATTLTTREDVNLQGQAAAAVVSLLPTLAVFAIAQRSLKLGFGAGSDR